jgi:hypothetical protein
MGEAMNADHEARAAFDRLYGHLQLSNADAAWHVFQSGWDAKAQHMTPAAYVYPEFFDSLAKFGCWTAYASDGKAVKHPDGVDRIPLYREKGGAA